MYQSVRHLCAKSDRNKEEKGAKNGYEGRKKIAILRISGNCGEAMVPRTGQLSNHLFADFVAFSKPPGLYT